MPISNQMWAAFFSIVKDTAGIKRNASRLGRVGAVRRGRGEIKEVNGHKFGVQQFYQIMRCALCSDLFSGAGAQCEGENALLALAMALRKGNDQAGKSGKKVYSPDFANQSQPTYVQTASTHATESASRRSLQSASPNLKLRRIRTRRNSTTGSPIGSRHSPTFPLHGAVIAVIFSR